MNDALLQSAVRFQDPGQVAEAARLYSEIIRANPAHFEALYRLGMIHLQSGRFGDARAPARRGHTAQPQVPAGALRARLRIAEPATARRCVAVVRARACAAA